MPTELDDAEAAILAAIIAEPAEDTPRLAYADWLDEHERHERAEFIRVQVELARHTDCPGGPPSAVSVGECDVCIALRRRERELFTQDNQARWSGVLLTIILAHPGFSRGFVSSLTCTWDSWRTHADAICARQPIERVKLTTAPVLDWWKQMQPKEPKDSPVATSYRFVGGPTVDTTNLPLWEVGAIEYHGEELLAGAWPKIEFELPPPEPSFWIGVANAGEPTSPVSTTPGASFAAPSHSREPR